MSKKDKKLWHKILKSVLIIIAVILLIVLGYVGYVFGTYSRIEDNQMLEADNVDDSGKLEAGKEYSVISYNIGFGAYSSDYSFFMDGGEYSRAFSKDAVIGNTNKDIDVIRRFNPDIVFFQEVDTDSTRSYHVDQVGHIRTELPEYSSIFAVNYHSAYLMYPILSPHGASNSGILTLAKGKLNNGIRRSLPISTDLSKILDLDRCYSKTSIDLENGKKLVLVNVHLSAYTSDVSIVHNQIKMLSDELKAEADAGNYVICGGDFNQDLLDSSAEVFGTGDMDVNWAKPFPKEKLAEGLTVVETLLTDEEVKALTPSCRNADIPYEKGKSFVIQVDGFIISDNVKLIEFYTIDTGFDSSDHNPVYMKFELEE